MTCDRCGSQEFHPPVYTPPDGSLEHARLWHRRMTCKACGYSFDSIMTAGIQKLTGATDRFDVVGNNPFLEGSNISVRTA